MVEPREPGDIQLAVERLRARSHRARADRVAAGAVSVLSRAGVPSILLKGPTVADWLYDDPAERAYLDADLLIEAGNLEAARAALTAAGYSRIPAVAPWTSPHGEAWRRAREPSVDLHWSLPGAPASEAIWAGFRSGATEMELEGTSVLAPAAPARALLLALHVAWHGEHSPKARRDLEQGLGRVEHDDWRAAAELARRLAVEPVLASAMRQLPSGAALADRLGLPAPGPAFPRGALVVRELAATRGARAPARARDRHPAPAGVHEMAHAARSARPRRACARVRPAARAGSGGNAGRARRGP